MWKCYHPILLLIWAIVKSNSDLRTTLLGVSTHGVSPKCIFMSSSLTNICLVHESCESHCLEYLGKCVIEPIDDILIFSLVEEVHVEHLALMLETLKNHLCVIMKFVF